MQDWLSRACLNADANLLDRLVKSVESFQAPADPSHGSVRFGTAAAVRRNKGNAASNWPNALSVSASSSIVSGSCLNGGSMFSRVCSACSSTVTDAGGTG